MRLDPGRRIPGDWYEGGLPDVVRLEGEAYVETAFSFYHCRARTPDAIRIAHGAHVYLSTMFDVGVEGRVSIGRYSVVTGARFVCDAQISIGDYATISWNVVFMDSYRLPTDPALRRHWLEQAARDPGRRVAAEVPAAPIVLGQNVWIGFDACVLPGVTVGRGAVVGARSVVTQDVAPYTVVAGNPARPVRTLSPTDQLPSAGAS